MSNPKNILIVGGTGRLGGFIIDAVLTKNADVHIRVLGRKKDDQLIQNSKGRLSFVEGDLTDPNYNLSEAVNGVDAIISAVIGDTKVTVEGQKRLIDAAKVAGVKQFIPSAFSVDYREAGHGWNFNWDMRKEVDAYLIASGVPYTIVNQGVFVEVALVPHFLGWISLSDAKVAYWGDNEDWKIEFTTYVDTGKIVAETLWDSWALNRYVCVHGDEASPRDIYNILQELTGKASIERLGSIDDLVALTGELLGKGEFMKAMPHMYSRGSFLLHSPHEDADRYQDIKFTTVKEAIAGALKEPAKWIYGPKANEKRQ